MQHGTVQPHAARLALRNGASMHRSTASIVHCLAVWRLDCGGVCLVHHDLKLDVGREGREGGDYLLTTVVSAKDQY